MRDTERRRGRDIASWWSDDASAVVDIGGRSTRQVSARHAANTSVHLLPLHNRACDVLEHFADCDWLRLTSTRVRPQLSGRVDA